jgi:hypothetical protein
VGLLLTAPFDLGNEFLAWIEEEIVEFKPVMVVLDSYLALRPLRGKSGDIVHTEKREVRELDELAKKHDLLIVLLHHESSTTKANALLDAFSRGAGTYGVTAAAESQLTITKFRELDGSTVRLVRAMGRHMPEIQMVVKYNADIGSFSHVIDGLASSYYPLLMGMKRDLDARPTFGPADLMGAMGISRAYAYRHLANLLNARAVVKNRDGSYQFSADVQRM